MLVLIAAILAAYFIDGDSDQSVPDQKVLALNQAGTQQPEPSASEATEFTAIQPLPETPAPAELAKSDIRNSAGAAGSQAGEPGNIPVTPSSDTSIDAVATQSKLSMADPVAAQASAPVMALSQGSQTKQAASPVPVKRPAVAPPLSTEEKIAELLAHGLRSLKSYRLLTPKNDNAYLYFQQVLKLDPGNSDALHGIEQIVASYTALATNALDQNDKVIAERYIARGFQISPNDAGLQALRDRLNTPLFEPPVIPAAEQEPEPENVFTRFKGFFTQPPNEKFESQPQADE